LRLISWNTNHRTRVAKQQAHALLSREPDLVALQEVTRSTYANLEPVLRDGGLAHIACSLADRTEPKGPRSLGVLIASRHPFELLPGLPIPWPEKALSIAVNESGFAFELHTVHIPPGSTNGWTKVEVLEGVAQGMAQTSSRSKIVCGDFNTPQLEMPTGEILTWAQRITPDGPVVRNTLRRGPGARWDAAERGCLDGPLQDVFRAVHGSALVEASWFLTRKGKRIGRRYDHIFASPEIQLRSCTYLHDWRTAGLSDHSAIEADLGIVGPESPS